VTAADPGVVVAAGPRASAAWIARLRGEAVAQGERWFLWAPVAAGTGAAAYFGLRSEPSLLVGLACVAAALVLAVATAVRGRNLAMAVAASLALFGALGFAGAGLRSALVAAPVVPAGLRPVMVEGWVVDVASASTERPRLLIAPTWVQDLAPDARPARIRITFRQPMLIGPGHAVRVRALLNPPPPPASPGSYDFARDAWFEQVGGAGLALGSAQVVSLQRPPFDLRVQTAINAARWSLARRLVERMGPETGGLAAALVTGHQAWLTEADIEAMRASGLAHILSISGVHMVIVGGFVFAVFRLGIAAWPWAALRIPGKKVAAAAGLAAVLVYLLISGAPPPAVRAAITASVAFIAILLDRRALTLHSLAIAALAVLALQPEAVTQPGFQMSFAATAALLALAEAWPRPEREINAPWPIVAFQRLRTWLIAAFMISFVAGLATGPFAIQHFNRITLWGLPANLATEALSTLVVLPMLAIGAALEYAGLSAGPLSLAAWGLEWTARLAHMFAGLPGAVVIVASAPAWALPASFLGLLFVCLWKGRMRWLGLPLFAAVSLAPRPPTPDLWIAPGGANAAVRMGGESVVLKPATQQFASELWTRRRGLVPPTDPQATADALFDCGRDACVPLAGAPVKVAAWWRRIPAPPEAVARLCEGAEVVILRTGQGACEGLLVLNQDDLNRGGAAEVYRDGDGWRVVWAQDFRGRRPWTRAPATAEE
jgi:competence protein ComEC